MSREKLRIYKVGDSTFQYRPGNEPEGAVLVEPKKPVVKKQAAAPKNKARQTVANKGAKSGSNKPTGRSSKARPAVDSSATGS